MREMSAAGMAMTDSGKLNGNTLYRTLRNRVLIGEREFDVGGEVYRLSGYYPPLLSADEFDALQLAVDRRQGKRGVGEIPSILTGMGIAVCGYCGASIVSQNLMGRKRQADGRPWPGHRRLICISNSSGHGCPVPGTMQAAPVERALMLYCSDATRMDALFNGGDHGRTTRAELAGARKRLADGEAKLKRLAGALAEDDGAAPLTVLRQMRELEAETELEKKSIDGLERELSGIRPAATPDLAEKWIALIDGVEDLDTDARMQARELTRASFSRIVIWHAGDPDGGEPVIDMEITARGGGMMKVRIDRSTGGLIE
jgi:hypothetical protein